MLRRSWRVVAFSLLLLSAPIAARAAGEQLYQDFNQFCLANFGATTEPLIHETFGNTPQFVDSGFWLYESRNSATVAFETSLPAMSHVEFGLTAAYGGATPEPDRPYYLHVHYLTGLQPNTLYHYRLVAIDELGQQITSADRTLTTGSFSSAIPVPGNLSGPPYVLNQAGATYILTQDISSNTRGISIKATNITIDLNGHTVTYDQGTPLLQGAAWDQYLYSDISTSGIHYFLWSTPGLVRILNGTIRQGQNNGRGSINVGFNPILIASGTVEVAGITAEYSGHSVGGIDNHFGELNGHHNIVVDRGTEIDNRSQGIKAIYCRTVGTVGVHHNLVKRARQQGIISSNGLQIYSNEVYIDSYATNSFGVGPVSQVHHNKIFGTGYHVVGVGFLDASNLTVHDNLIFLQGMAPNTRSDEYGSQSSVNGLRLTQYNGGNTVYANNLYEGNTIIIKARDGCSSARGLEFFSDRYISNLHIRHNTVKVETQDAVTPLGSCVVAQGNDSSVDSQLPLYYEDNLFITNSVHVRFGDDYGSGGNHQFRNNVFRKFGNRADYRGVRIGWWTRDSYNNRLIDNAVEGGADVRNYLFEGVGRRDYTVGHSLYLLARGAGGVPLANDSLRVVDNTGTNYRLLTDGAGLARIELLEDSYVALANAAQPTRVTHQNHTLQIDGYLPYVVDANLFQVANNPLAPVTLQFTSNGQPVDTSPPAAVTTLAVGSTTAASATLTWTAVGDDDNIGTAASYDLRYATTPITAVNFSSATPVNGEPLPTAPGSSQSMTVGGLASGSTYYFALKTADEKPNWSALSNVTSGTTTGVVGSDTTPPATISDLALTAVTASTASLGWTAPGDDGGTGTAAQYDLRYSTAPITAANFGAATAASGEPVPATAGGNQTFSVSGLAAGSTYYFALRTGDEVPNWSGLSNVVSGTTAAGGGPDTTPPAAVTNLSAGSITRSSLVLSWTAPGDDGNSGQAYRYAFLFSPTPINAGNFWQANPIYTMPTPSAPGTVQSQIIQGLDPGATYYFAMATTDEAFNYSPMSNVLAVTTLAPPTTGDTVAPAMINDLHVTATSATSVTVTWTAPGDDGTSGTATGYDMHSSLLSITPANFAGARRVNNVPAPTVAGTQQSVTIANLQQGTAYYFALRATDENDNWSAVSNSTSGTPGTPPSGDATPPGAVTNMAVAAPTATSLTLSWAAPGDDGSTGTATSYDLRYSTALITAANFGSATAVVGEPAPGAPGATQSQVVSGLSAGTTYYFALKTGDEVPNWSAISNVPSGATTAAPPPTDTTPPAAVTNLALGSPTTTSLLVSWNAPGDDGSAGTAATYDLRYSTSAITAANFGVATAAAGEPTPGVAGAAQSMTVTGLAAGTTYFFALKTADEVPNWSALSNTPSAATSSGGPPADTTPPAAVSSLAVGSPTTSSLTVSWTAPGDDASAGTATSYDLRYSTSAITAANFAAATAAIGEPAPAVAGSAQSMGIAGLASGTKYYFALKTGDEVPNWSAISNLPSGTTTTPGDVTPPAAVTNLAASNIGNTAVTVSWTAPGDDGTTGTATQYDMRWATYPITAANFGTADFVTTEPVPSAAGTSQSCTISGLGAGYTYYFALKTRDEVSNWSGVSNTVTATTIALPPPDTTPPASIIDLKSTGVTHQTITVSWTSPGDDGNIGRATSYDLRYSLLPITDQNFNSATLVSGEPAPGVVGTVQSLTVRGLSSRKTYYFALKAADEVPNWSTLSNPLTAATIDPPPVLDAIAPATVSDLELGTPTEASLTVGWTAPGDDDNIGQATSYDLRYSTAPITAQNFDLATSVANPPAPAESGTPESMVVGGLSGATLYYFALKTADEVPNWSAVSNFVSGATAAPPPPPDTTAPGAVLDLAVESTTNSGVTLSWSAPGDDQDSGQAVGYDLRYSEAPLNLASFEAAAQATGEPTPLPAGVIQSFSVEGLNPGVTYHFALRTVDDAGNWSNLSNVPAGTTQQEASGDTTPPSAVNNLLVGSATQTSLNVSWSAPGDDGLAGVAGSYDLRYSNVAITGANFAAATPVAGEPTPAAAGTTQSTVITGLNPGTTYYFALKTADDVPNWSGISNVSSGATQNEPPPDTRPPGTTNTLAAGSATATSLTLSWLAPGDDGNVGLVAGYDVRVSRSIITPSNFGQATAVAGAPNPRNAGSLQSLPVTGLDPNTIYYFALKSTDDVGNVSAMSNVAGGTTLVAPPPPDRDPPSAVNGLSVTAESPTRVTVSWTAPGDDADTGVAAAYDLRYSTNAATAAAFDGATALAGEPTPTAPGSTQSLTLQGLAEGTTYHFVLKTADEVPNWSAVSNVASVTMPVSPPPPDTVPPSAVADLRITAIGEMTVQLEWSAPADDGGASPAHHYDVRYSSVEISNENFGNASPVASPPAPLEPGQPQTMTVIELLSDVTYYFALRSYDEAGNASFVSNLVTATTLTPPPPPPVDTTPPAGVPTLQVVAATQTSLTLAWPAPGDDGEEGTATAYDLRYRVGEFAAADFNLASEVQGEPTPAAAGGAESFTLTGLIAGTSYRFALRTVDEAGNWSEISNVAVGATESAPPPPPPGDTTPPATTSLMLVSAGADTAVLSWVAPGDDTTSGRASLLAMRLDVRPITDDRWAQALVVIGLPQPAAAGTVQRVTVYGLLPSTLYYFAFRARDDVGNWSDVGPSLDVRTQDQIDTSPPLAPAGLNGKPEAAQVDLYWEGSPDPAVVGYHVYRRVGTEAWERLNGTLLQATSFSDQHPAPGAHYDYAVTAVDSHGQESPKSASFSVAIPGETIADLAVVVPPTPNPFRQSMSLSVVVPATRAENVLAAVFDVQGALVRILHDGPLPAGEQSLTWDGRGANGQPARAGIYFVQLRGGARTLINKVVLTR